MPVKFELPPKGSLVANGPSDPLRYYYAPLVGRIFRARIDTGLALLEGPYRRLLEVGFGSGLLLPTLTRTAGRVDGIDLESDPDDVRRNLAALGVAVGDLTRGDVRSLPYAAGTFDCVIAYSIFEHLKGPDLPPALSEVRRVMTTGGHFLVGCPAVHAGMSAAFAAIGFSGIDQHHFSSIHNVLDAARPAFDVEKTSTLPSFAPLGLAPYNTALLRAGA